MTAEATRIGQMCDELGPRDRATVKRIVEGMLIVPGEGAAKATESNDNSADPAVVRAIVEDIMGSA